MLHACLCTNCLVFCSHLVAFFVFSGINLLTRCHSASSLFSVVFVFRKSYTGNILGIGRNEARSSYFPPTRDGVQRRVGGWPGVTTLGGGVGGPLCTPPYGVGPLATL
jgi:hypothetical protein